MRITVLTSSYPRFAGDGAAPFVQSISEHIADLGHDVAVVAPYDAAVRGPAAGAAAVRRFRYAPVAKWHIVGHARSLVGDQRFRPGVFLLLPFFVAAEFLAGLRVARRQHADIIHAHWVLPNGLLAAWVAAVLRIPLAVSLHGSDVFVALRNPLFGRVAGWVFRRAAVVTACSEELAQAALRLGADPGKVHLVAWGADPGRFHPAVPPTDRRRFGLTADDTVLVCLGRIVPKKGFDVLLRALPAILRAAPATHVLIGGDGPQREELGRLAAELGVAEHVHFAGQIPWDQVAAFLAAGDIFLLPSVRDAAGNLDGLPTVLLEAMALGKPVVASRIAGVPLVIEDGVNGLLCPAGDADALAAAVAGLLADPPRREALGRAGRRSVEERFNWREVARRFVALFGDAAAKTTMSQNG